MQSKLDLELFWGNKLKQYSDKFSSALAGFLSRSIHAGATVRTAQDTPCKATLPPSISPPTPVVGHYSPLTTTIDFFVFFPRPDEVLAII